MILDLGCGIEKVPGAIGVDCVALTSVDVIADICKVLPFRENTFDQVYLNDVIEHVPNTIRLMEEIHRVARPDALVHIRVVNYNTQYMAIDPTHVRAFHEETFSFFGSRPGRNYYTHARFETLSVSKGWDALAKRVLRSERLLNIAARYLMNVLIDLHFTLRVIKPVDAGPKIYGREWD